MPQFAKGGVYDKINTMIITLSMNWFLLNHLYLSYNVIITYNIPFVNS